jgi:uncharacterized protein
VIPVLFGSLALLTALHGALLEIVPFTAQQTALLSTTTIVIGGVPLTVEVADEPAARSQGLGNRDSLSPGTGMLFVFAEPAPRSFWMKGMRFCLDMVWIGDGVVQGATTNVCPPPAGSEKDLPSYWSPVPVAYVLEVPAGWVETNGVGVGTPVDGLPPLSAI